MDASGVAKTESVPFDRSYGGLVRTETQSGIPVKAVYTPEDIKHLDYEQDLGNPGDYPYTRGIYQEMYRNKLWLKSFIVSYTTLEETNEAFRQYIAAGQTALRLLADLPIQSGIDPDHPSSWNSMLCGGCSTYSLETYETMLDGLPLENIDYELAHSSISSPLFFYSLLVAMMEKRGLNIANLRGNAINDPIRARLVYESPDFPTEINRRVCEDLLEFGVKNTPKWYAFAPNGVDPQQMGMNVFQEVAEVLGVAIAVYGDMIKQRGFKLDDFGGTVFSMDAESDFFETIAKFRAARKMWAKIAKERLGATTPRAMSLRIGIRTSGLSLQAQKPLNNAARVTLQILSCILGGVNSLDASSIDEAVGLPSYEARMFNLDTQHIITHEANVPLTVDPLGGSYYVEWLTSRIEEKAYELLEEIDGRGGMWECLESGWLKQQAEASRLKVQREQSIGERLIVGVNAFRGEEGPINKAVRGTTYKVPSKQARLRVIRAIRQLREKRDQRRTGDTLKELYQATREGRNVVRPVIEAAKASATIGEVVGTIRMAYNYDYDPLAVISEPAFINELVGR